MAERAAVPASLLLVLVHLLLWRLKGSQFTCGLADPG